MFDADKILQRLGGVCVACLAMSTSLTDGWDVAGVGCRPVSSRWWRLTEGTSPPWRWHGRRQRCDWHCSRTRRSVDACRPGGSLPARRPDRLRDSLRMKSNRRWTSRRHWRHLWKPKIDTAWLHIRLEYCLFYYRRYYKIRVLRSFKKTSRALNNEKQKQ